MASNPAARRSAKKARRRKRQAVRWAPEPVPDEEVDAIGAALADVDDWVADRGWVLDATDFDNLVSWVYPPSAADVDDEATEPVTRIWITVSEDDEEVVLEFGAVLVGTGRADRQ